MELKHPEVIEVLRYNIIKVSEKKERKKKRKRKRKKGQRLKRKLTCEIGSPIQFPP